MKRRIAIVAIGVLALFGGSAGVNAVSAGSAVPKTVTAPTKAKVLCVYQDLVAVKGFCIPTIY